MAAVKTEEVASPELVVKYRERWQASNCSLDRKHTIYLSEMRVEWQHISALLNKSKPVHTMSWTYHVVLSFCFLCIWTISIAAVTLRIMELVNLSKSGGACIPLSLNLFWNSPQHTWIKVILPMLVVPCKGFTFSNGPPVPPLLLLTYLAFMVARTAYSVFFNLTNRLKFI